MRAVEAVEALAARGDRADDDPLANRVVLLEAFTELLDDANRLMTEDESRADGYSPRTICTSVPQIVVALMRITASPAFGRGFGTSSTRMSLTPWKTTAFIVFITPLFQPDPRG